MKHHVQIAFSLSLSMFFMVGLFNPLQWAFPARAEEAQQEAAFPQDICTTILRIMPLGDSITKGSSGEVPINEPGKMIAYRKDLWDSLQAAEYDVDFVGSQTNGQDYPGFDPKHEGHPGQPADWVRDNIYDGYSGSGSESLNFLQNEPNVVLLHIGTNDIYAGQPAQDVTAEVGQILDEIDQYENDNNRHVTVILAQIINKIYPSATWTEYNTYLEQMVQGRAGDDIILVNMETGAGIIYKDYTAGGDMFFNGSNGLHPYHTGYAKMAAVWKQAIDSLYQDCNQAPDVLNPGDQTSMESDQVSLQIEAADPEQDTLTFTASGLPPGLSIGEFSGLISGQIAADASEGSPYEATVTVTDDGDPVRSSEVTFAWEVLPLLEVYVPVTMVRVSR